MSPIILPTLGVIAYFLMLHLLGPFEFTNGYVQFAFLFVKLVLPLASLPYLLRANGAWKFLGCLPLLWSGLAAGGLLLSYLFWPSRDLKPSLYKELDHRTLAGYDIYLWVNCGGGAMGHCITQLVQQKQLTPWLRIHKPIANLGRYYKTTIEPIGPTTLRVRAAEGIEPPIATTVEITGPW